MMQDLYSEKDSEQISSQLKKRYILLGCILAVILAGFVVSMIIRVEWLSVVMFILLLAGWALGWLSVLIVSALHGRTHTETLEYEKAEDDTSVVDGVLCRGLLFLGSPDKHGTREQRFYWDEEIPLPAFVPGSQVTLKYTGRNITGYEL